MPRSHLTRATRISNPGCYATAAQIAIAPLVPHLGGLPTIFGVSGYSGAGTRPSPKNDVKQLADNLMPYSLTDHIHEREIGSRLGAPVAFIPHVAVWFQGIHHTVNIPLSKEMTSREIRNLYQDRYAGEKLIKVTGEAPLVKNIAGKHGVVSFHFFPSGLSYWLLTHRYYRRLADSEYILLANELSFARRSITCSREPLHSAYKT